MNTLLTFIGSNDEGLKDEGPIMTILSERKFDEIYLLFNTGGKTNSGKQYSEIASEIKNKIIERSYNQEDSVFIHEINIEIITDHIDVYTNLLAFLQKEFPNEKIKERNFTAAISSGTPAMHTSWVIIAETGVFPLKLIRSEREEHANSESRVIDLRIMTDTIERFERLKAFDKLTGAGKPYNPFEVIDPLNLNDAQIMIAIGKEHILIYGETGVGKELLAKTIHEKSKRRGEFFPVNCAGLSAEFLESELFGHEKGAFTGAMFKKAGLVEEYTNGTIFLDEINSAPLHVQAKLLRFLDDGEYKPLGSNKTKKSDARIIAAGNENLAKLVSQGKFREDLYYRLRTFEFYIPPLRERKEQIPVIIKRIFHDLIITKECLNLLMNHDYKGNVRELRIIIERLKLQTSNNEIKDSILVNTVLEGFKQEYSYSDITIPSEIHEQAFKLLRQILANAALSQSSNSQEAARILGVSRGSVVDKWAEGKE